jgi:hypothetical protein
LVREALTHAEYELITVGVLILAKTGRSRWTMTSRISRPLTRSRTIWEMSRPIQTRRRRLQALVVAALAIGLVIVEPFPKGVVLLSLTPTHGVDVGDLPALALLVVAACLAFVS